MAHSHFHDHAHLGNHSPGHAHAHVHAHGHSTPHPSQPPALSIMRMGLGTRLAVVGVLVMCLWALVWVAMRPA